MQRALRELLRVPLPLLLLLLLSSDRTSGTFQRLSTIVGADVVAWDVGRGVQTACDHRDVLTQVSPWWYFPESDGSLITRLQSGALDREVTARLRSCGLRIVPTVANYRDGWDVGSIEPLLHDATLRAKHVSALASLVDSHELDGIDVDYEFLADEDRDAFTAFVSELARALHGRGKVVMISVQPPAEFNGDRYAPAYDYATLARTADQLRIMAYDLHWSESTPGPISPVGWAESVLRYALSQVPPDKIILGLGLFGYDWVGAEGQALTWADVQKIVSERSAEGQMDANSSSPHFTYTQEGVTHAVWYEDGRSVAAKLDLAARYGVGVYFWRLGGEDPAIWPMARAGLPGQLPV